MNKQLKTIISNANAAIDLAFAYGVMLPKHREAAKGLSAEEFKAALLPTFASRFGCTTKEKGTGRIVMQGDKTSVNSATRALNRYTDDVFQTSKRTEEKLAVPEHIQALARKLAKACSEYEQARKLASTAISAAFAK